MSIIGWIVLGLIAGFIAGQIVNRRGQGLIWDIVLGIVGAIVVVGCSPYLATKALPASISTPWGWP
jgi:uncharacterized membrane protein YeaQ/YmgE (transglycosylase-associated protein family)